MSILRATFIKYNNVEAARSVKWLHLLVKGLCGDYKQFVRPWLANFGRQFVGRIESCSRRYSHRIDHTVLCASLRPRMPGEGLCALRASSVRPVLTALAHGQ